MEHVPLMYPLVLFFSLERYEHYQNFEECFIRLRNGSAYIRSTEEFNQTSLRGHIIHCRSAIFFKDIKVRSLNGDVLRWPCLRKFKKVHIWEHFRQKCIHSSACPSYSLYRVWINSPAVFVLSQNVSKSSQVERRRYSSLPVGLLVYTTTAMFQCEQNF